MIAMMVVFESWDYLITATSSIRSAIGTRLLPVLKLLQQLFWYKPVIHCLVLHTVALHCVLLPLLAFQVGAAVSMDFLRVFFVPSSDHVRVLFGELRTRPEQNTKKARSRCKQDVNKPAAVISVLTRL